MMRHEMGRRGAGAGGGGARHPKRTVYRGMGRAEQEDVFGQFFGWGAGGGGARREVVQEYYTLPSGQRMRRTTTTTRQPDGSVSKTVEEGPAEGPGAFRGQTQSQPGWQEERPEQQLSPFLQGLARGLLYQAARRMLPVVLAAVQKLLRRLLLGR